MMEVIFLDGVDGLVFLANQCTKNTPQHLFGVIHLIRTYLMTNFSTLLCTHQYTVWITLPPPFLQFRTYLMDQKTNKNIRILYSLKYKHSKIKLFTKKQMVVQDEINIQESSIDQKSSSTMSVMLCMGDYFRKEKLLFSCQNSFI